MSHKPSRLRLGKKISRSNATKPQGNVRATRNPKLASAGGNSNSVGTREFGVRAQGIDATSRAGLGRERRSVPGAPGPHAAAADVERLIAELREANERLIVAAVRAEFVSDDARTEAARARAELDGLMDRLQEANAGLVTASAEARALEQQARQREEDYRRLSLQLLQLQDEERRRLAVDLHDSTAQHLAALTMNLDLLEGAGYGLDARLSQALAESRSLAAQCDREVRTFAYLLHPPLLDELGLLPAVRWYVEGFTKRSGIQVDLDLDDVDRLPGPMEIAFFRIVQESLTNVHRHAASSTASIHLTSTAHAVTLEVQDRGGGLPDSVRQGTRAVPPGTLGVGIQGMRERIRQLGGTFDISFTDAGTTVRVRVPLHERVT